MTSCWARVRGERRRGYQRPLRAARPARCASHVRSRLLDGCGRRGPGDPCVRGGRDDRPGPVAPQGRSPIRRRHEIRCRARGTAATFAGGTKPGGRHEDRRPIQETLPGKPLPCRGRITERRVVGRPYHRTAGRRAAGRPRPDSRRPQEASMRVSRVIVAAVLFAVGLVWIGQGTGKIAGSAMSGTSFWAAAGVILVVLAIVILVRERRLSAKGSRSRLG